MRIRYMLLLGLASVALILWLGVFLAALQRGWHVTKCPTCLSDRIRPSWPRMRDKLLRPSLIKPYRCEACRRRFYALKRVRLRTDSRFLEP
jgi:hypothetical protein